jgi:agmatinase
MSYRELFVSPSAVFVGNQQSLEEADYAILGVPFDGTSTYRPGSRFAPNAIREASPNIEGYSFRTGTSISDLRIYDMGDLHVTGDVELTLGRLALVANDIFEAQKIPVFLGGEHTITLGVMRGLDEKVAVVSFDAHLDLRNEYLGLSVSHATFMRRINEDVKPAKILEIGTRAVGTDELEYAKEAGIDYITAHKIREDGAKTTAENIRNTLESYEKVYVTIDMDVLDPAFVPAVPNPEPEGLDTPTLLELLGAVCDNRTVGVDLVEIAPHYDKGLTAVQATKILFELLLGLDKARRS